MQRKNGREREKTKREKEKSFTDFVDHFKTVVWKITFYCYNAVFIVVCESITIMKTRIGQDKVTVMQILMK